MIAAPERERRTCNGARVDPGVGRALNILVVDDVEPVASILQEGLTQFGQTASYALSGEEALRVFGETEIDAIVSDVEMPGMNGWELGKRLKDVCSKQGIRKPAFILLTGWGEETGAEERMGPYGVDAFVTKPVDLRELLDVMRNAVVGRPEPDQAQ